ncbi:site-specific DNA-methyltransferase [Riemerella anatipestifer]|uniref:site-specific DNA-methyltransferase n=1 Tax=Riemerella anatipestifer TaxID=34085 RepID=UPI0023644123|nr:site-specific DNA-methyltransferase [Riemerella anatipestifer]MDD1523790.1 site-specific DNA-methyltransferase [Riemerella anatipestifer]
MAKQYKGSLSLDWYNKQKSILLRGEEDIKLEGDIPAPKINWINKDEALFYEVDEKEGKGLTPYWVDRTDIRVKEARPLLLQKVYKAVEKDKEGSLPDTSKEWTIEESTTEDPTVENILIKGDNLLALNTLKKMFDNKPEEEKVKCIYIDPPFNTEQAFDHYDDNLEHSEWLTMIRDRIISLKSLLRMDGILILHLDSKELHYAKVLMDEVFGRDNFIADITYERSSVAGLGQGGVFVSTTENILIYHNGLVNTNVVVSIEEIELKTLKRYNKYITDFGSKELVEEFNSKSNNLPVKIYKHNNFSIETISLAKFEERKEEILNLYIKNFETVFRPFLVQKENKFQHDLISKMDSDSLYSVEYIPSRGKKEGELTNLFYIGGGLIAWLKDTASHDSENIGKETKLSTVWKHSEIPKADLHNEGGVSFARSKKPENLLKRIFEICTNNGDIILDAFGGSGSTFGVAHKMNRRWIGIEIGEHANTHIVPRLKSVLDGSDQSGISKSVNWQGGGSFKYYHLGESIIKVNEDGTGDFNWSLGRSYIEEAFLSSYDYTLDTTLNLAQGFIFGDNQIPLIGIQQVGTKTRVAVVSLNAPNEDNNFMTYDEIFYLYQQVKKHFNPQYINVFTNRGVEIAYDSKPEDLEVIKIPQAIFAELEK